MKTIKTIKISKEQLIKFLDVNNINEMDFDVKVINKENVPATSEFKSSGIPIPYPIMHNKRTSEIEIKLHCKLNKRTT